MLYEIIKRRLFQNPPPTPSKGGEAARYPTEEACTAGILLWRRCPKGGGGYFETPSLL